MIIHNQSENSPEVDDALESCGKTQVEVRNGCGLEVLCFLIAVVLGMFLASGGAVVAGYRMVGDFDLAPLGHWFVGGLAGAIIYPIVNACAQGKSIDARTGLALLLALIGSFCSGLIFEWIN